VGASDECTASATGFEEEAEEGPVSAGVGSAGGRVRVRADETRWEWAGDRSESRGVCAQACHRESARVAAMAHLMTRYM
jgi:hypothetical protein